MDFCIPPGISSPAHGFLCASPGLPWPVESSPGFHRPFLATSHPCYRLHRGGHLFVAAGPSAAD
uniref:Predicted gene, 57854 n=1 Tax=Mus musculus TaxID=10090 RepID=A0A140LJJ6_MOUSE